MIFLFFINSILIAYIKYQYTFQPSENKQDSKPNHQIKKEKYIQESI